MINLNAFLLELLDAILTYTKTGWPRLHVLVPGQIRAIGHYENRVC